MQSGEVVIGTLDNITCYPKEKPGKTIFGSTVGKFVLTNRRVLFLSSGEADNLGAYIVSGFMTPAPPDTYMLDESALANKGSFQASLDRVTEAVLVKRLFGASNYLRITYLDDYGGVHHACLLGYHKIPEEVVQAIDNARRYYRR
ncbi:MAG: hypothetical protein J7L61_04170 [Thermoplasmata archaeon]|nr:hypothetical protein [Thermoplasmata archaeon]